MSAEKSARQAASVVVGQTDPNKLAQVGTDPFGNPIMAPGQDLSGAAVPAVQGGPRDPVAERLEKAEQARLAAIERERARQDAMRRAPIMAPPLAFRVLAATPMQGLSAICALEDLAMTRPEPKPRMNWLRN